MVARVRCWSMLNGQYALITRCSFAYNMATNICKVTNAFRWMIRKHNFFMLRSTSVQYNSLCRDCLCVIGSTRDVAKSAANAACCKLGKKDGARGGLPNVHIDRRQRRKRCTCWCFYEVVLAVELCWSRCHSCCWCCWTLRQRALHANHVAILLRICICRFWWACCRVK